MLLTHFSTSSASKKPDTKTVPRKRSAMDGLYKTVDFYLVWLFITGAGRYVVEFIGNETK